MKVYSAFAVVFKRTQVVHMCNWKSKRKMTRAPFLTNYTNKKGLQSW